VKIKFSNLGAIKETELDLRPLTVIIGPNNSNKTYVAYCIYGLWKEFISTVSGRLINIIKVKKESINTISIEITELITLFIEEHNNKKESFKDNLDKFFQDSSRKLFSKTNFTVELSEEKVRQALDSIEKQNNLDSPLSGNLDIRSNGDILHISILENSDIQSINTDLSKEDNDIKIIIVPLIFALNEQLFLRPFLLPAERNAFIITYKILANRRFNLLKKNQRELFLRNRDGIKRQLDILREQGDIRYPEPIEDFLDFLTDSEFKKNVKLNPASKNEFQKLADKIERYIVNKNRISYESTVLEGKEIKVKVNRDLTIDLHNASSSIKQLTPLLLYLRYRAKKNDLLIIDEPEMNLHPESQAKLLEIFGILVNLGIKVLITTHSPYLMDYLNSLVIGKVDNPNFLKQQAKVLYLKDERAFIALDEVSAYEMRDSELHSLKDEDGEIRWDTLSDVSHELQSKYFQIYKKGQ